MYSYKQNKYELNKAKKLKYNNLPKNNSNQKNKIKIMNEHYIGTRDLIFQKNNFNSYKYFFKYDNLYQIPISEHVFLTIKKIKWSFADRVNVHIDRNGDLVSRIYFDIKLPGLSVEYNDLFKKTINYIKLFVYTHDEINFDTFKFSKYLKELYIEYESFNNNLINLPQELKLLSICSKFFNSNLTNLPINLEYLYINSDYYDTNLNNLPERLKVLSIVTSKLTIKLDNLPQGLKILNINSQYISNPEIFSYLPESLEYLYINCNDLKMINLSDLPVGLKVLSIVTTEPIDNNILSILPQNLIQKNIHSSLM